MHLTRRADAGMRKTSVSSDLGETKQIKNKPNYKQTNKQTKSSIQIEKCIHIHQRETILKHVINVEKVNISIRNINTFKICNIAELLKKDIKSKTYIMEFK